MAEVQLTSKTAEQIPTSGKYGKNACQGENAENVNIVGKRRQQKNEEKKDYYGYTRRENKHFVSYYGK